MFLHWAYILIGDNDTGKTSFQRNLVGSLCNEHYERLPRNVVKSVRHPRAPKRFQTVFTCNRSYQEKLGEYKTVENYFNNFFEDADVCFLSSHAHGGSINHVEQMIHELHRRCYNVGGIFWSNGFSSEAEQISLLPWQERIWIENPPLTNQDKIRQQLADIAREFAETLVSRAYLR